MLRAPALRRKGWDCRLSKDWSGGGGRCKVLRRDSPWSRVVQWRVWSQTPAVQQVPVWAPWQQRTLPWRLSPETPPDPTLWCVRAPVLRSTCSPISWAAEWRGVRRQSRPRPGPSWQTWCGSYWRWWWGSSSTRSTAHSSGTTSSSPSLSICHWWWASDTSTSLSQHLPALQSSQQVDSSADSCFPL